VFFLQKRTGLDNQIFEVIKLRTMHPNAEAHTRQATPNDARITRAGRFLRRFHLDEIPQFINVWLGQMSVVGPRPHMLNHTEEYRQLIGDFMVRHYIKPGVTGLAQSHGLSGEITHTDLLLARVKADVYYLENWSIWLDIKVVLETLVMILFSKKEN
jgi:putative colanic acid biosynthesis UDP-glucose lipid carrier transferase